MKKKIGLMIVVSLLMLSGCATSKYDLVLEQIKDEENSENVEILTMQEIEDSVAVISKTQGGAVKKWLFFISDYTISSSYPGEELRMDEIQLATICNQTECDSILYINAEQLRAIDVRYPLMDRKEGSIFFHQELSQKCHILVHRIPLDYGSNPEITKYGPEGNILEQ